ncbi:hypothetical protein LTR85_010838 [Meristemomyces frigidus]|nr:hypothetical protein LTR85_010838 [Meristemomyces frigidus]
MVYRGKLSKACAECRAKKTRCDTGQPYCGQCRRVGRLCSGYRNLDGLRVLEQTSEVVSRCINRSERRPVRSPERKNVDRTQKPVSAATSGSVASPLPGVFGPSFVLGVTAPNIFFTQFVNIGSGYTKTDFDFVKSIYPTVSENGMLADMVSALGMLSVARKNNEQSIRLAAAQKYARALCLTQQALEDADRVRLDETVATVALLALHESLMLETPYNMAISAIHLEGASELLRLRGQEQFRSKVGRHMFARLASQIVMSCLHAERPVPNSLLLLMREARNCLWVEETLAMVLLDIAARLSTVPTLGNNYEMTALLAAYHASVAIERDLADWAASLTSRFLFRRVTGKQSDETLLATHDIYETHIAAAHLNRYRCIRIGVNEKILRFTELISARLPEADKDIISQQQQSLACIVRLSEDICYSVRFFLDRGEAHLSREGSGPSMYASTTILPPLYIAANKDRVAPHMYQWILAQITNITRASGSACVLPLGLGPLAVWSEKVSVDEPDTLHDGAQTLCHQSAANVGSGGSCED